MTAQEQQRSEDDEFYEVMPYTSGFTYQDDVAYEPEDEMRNDLRSADQSAKTTAIITLVVVVLAALLLGLLAMRGLQMIHDTTTLPTSSGSL